MKKKLFVLLLVSILAVTMFVSCNSSPNSENSGSGANTPTVVPIDFSSLEGTTWKDTTEPNYYITFNSGYRAATLTYDPSNSSSSSTGAYTVSISGDVMTFTSVSSSASYSYKCTVSGNTMTLVKESNSATMPGVTHESWKRN